MSLPAGSEKLKDGLLRGREDMFLYLLKGFLKYKHESTPTVENPNDIKNYPYMVVAVLLDLSLQHMLMLTPDGERLRKGEVFCI